MLTSVLPVGSRARSIAFSAVAGLVALLVVQFVLPGTPGGGRGTPMAILFNGLVTGCAVALTALGLLMVYRSLRVINFMQVAIGAAGGRLLFEFAQFTPVPFPIALLLSVVLGALVGVAFDLIFGRRFFNAPRIVLTIVTIAASSFMIFMGNNVASLPIFPRMSSRTAAEAGGFVPSRPFLPFHGWNFKVGHYNTTYGFPEVLNIELLLLGIVGVVLFLRFTRSGVAIRALSENSERASLLGIPVGNLSTMVWAISGVLGTLSVICVGALSAPAAGVGSGAQVSLLLAPLTAAVIARFQSIPTAIYTALLLSAVSGAFVYSYPSDTGLVQVGYFVLVTVVLVVQRKRLGRSEEGTGVGWAALKESRAIPKEMAKLATVRTTRWVFIGAAIVTLVVFPIVVPARFQFLGATVLIQAIVGLSLVVLTGWAGQISLGQFAFAAVGGAVAGCLTSKHGIPFWFAVPIGSAVAGAFAALVGLPALRLKGLFLGVTTLALAIATSAVLFDDRYFKWLVPDSVDRPTLFFLNFDHDRPMYYLCLVFLVLAIIVVLNLRRSRFGRLLIALRENEANVQSFGVSAVRLKLTAFAVSGALAGFSGAVFVHQQRGVSPDSFSPDHSVQVLLFTVLGGIGSVGGALLGSLYDNLFRYFLSANAFLSVVSGAIQQGGGPLLVLYLVPGGLVSVAIATRDSWLRIIAQRRQIVVPSLFADYDPAAIEHRLIPLADPDANSGLAALGPGAHFRLGSELHGGAGRDAVPALRGRDDERLAIGAAASAALDVEGEGAVPHDVVGATLAAGREDS